MSPDQPFQDKLSDGSESSGVTNITIEDEVQQSFLEYAMSVIVSRALPDVRDGLKPVHRRILFAALEAGLRPDRHFRKCAALVGDVMKKYHPHGDQSIYDALARLAQDFSTRYLLIDGQGNFGSIDGDAPAAMRYCVSGDARVRLPLGSPRIADIADVAPHSETEVELKVAGRDGSPVLANKIFHSGDHPTLRLRTSEGFELEGTHNHPVLCLESFAGVPMLQWKLLDEITHGDYVALLRTPAVEEEVLGEKDWMLATLAGAGIADDPSQEKCVPSFVWERGIAFKRAFLQALFEGDGSSSLLLRNTMQISYSTRSFQLAQDVQGLLLEFGIISRQSGSARGEIKVVISNRRDARLFAERVGFFGRKQEKLLAQLGRVPLTSTAMSSDHVPFIADYIRTDPGSAPRQREWLVKHNVDRIERWERDGDEILSHIDSDEVKAVVGPLVRGNYYFARVCSVEDAGIQPVYSLRVESEDHAFITNGFVSHNTESRLSKLSMELLRNIDEETVEFEPNYDGYEQQPTVLPARFPNLLVNGSSGIAVGMATNIPPHNLREVIDACLEVLADPDLVKDDAALLAVVMKHIKGPDFPTGALIVGKQGIVDAYTSGRGSVKMRAVCEIEEGPKGNPRIVVTELPYQVNKARLTQKIAELVNAKEHRLEGIADLRDESSERGGMRLVIDLKKSAVPQVVLNTLYKRTQLQDNFGVNMLALDDGVPRTMNLGQVIKAYINHQIDVIGRRTRYRLRKAEERSHILEGLIIALDHIDEIVALIRAAADVEMARAQLIERFGLSDIQAQHILDMPLRRLTGLEQDKIRAEYAELQNTIAELKAILGDPRRVLKIISEELTEIKDKFGDARRSRIVPDEGEFDIEDLIADEDLVVSVSRDGYVKSVPLDAYRRQGRGGRGVKGAGLKEGDIVEHLMTSTAHAYLLLFSNNGRVYRIKAHEIPKRDRTARGTAVVNVVPMRPEDKVAAVIDTRDYETYRYLLIATKKGMVKKTTFRDYDSSRKEGIIALNLKDGDEVVRVSPTSGEDDVLLITKKGKAIRFSEKVVRPMGRTATGVIGIRIDADDEVVSAGVVSDDQELLVLTEGGFGKRTKLAQFPKKGRGGKGVIAMKVTRVRGQVVGASVVRPGDEVFVISNGGVVIRMAVDTISRQGRPATGVRVMNLDGETKVSALAPVVGEVEDTGQEQLPT